MKLLLDTHIFLWVLKDDRQIAKCKTLIRDNPEEVLISSVSIWETAIKVSSGKLAAAVEKFESQITENGFQPLPVTVQHAVEYSRLPMHHKDPFDRMLVAQSIVEGARLVTHDARLSTYGAFVLIV